MNVTSSFIKVTTKSAKQGYASQVWELLNDAYAQVKGGLHFSSIDDLLDNTNEWRLSVVNKQIIAVIILKAKKGLKISAFCLNRKFKALAKQKLISMIKDSLRNCWIEVSEAAEQFIMKQCNGCHFLINNQLAHELLNKEASLSSDGFHYSRNVNGIMKEKLIIGTPNG